MIYGVADAPYIEQVAKQARRSFTAPITWTARAELDALYAKNDLQHRAILEAVVAHSIEGARLLAREHVLSSGELLEAILDFVETRARPGLALTR